MKLSIKMLVLGLVIILGLSCEPKEDSAKSQQELDITAPLISVSGITDEIEKMTTIEVVVTTTSAQLATIISINGNQVFTSSEKQFTYTIDPFAFPTGENMLVVTSTDLEGNDTSASFPIIVKKLLFRGSDGLSSESVDSFIAINIMATGELIAFRKINTLDDLAFYASDDFIKQDLVITEYLMSEVSGFNIAKSYAGIIPGTELFTLSEVREKLGLEDRSFNKDAVFEITVEDATAFGLFSSLGADYSFYSTDTGNPTLTMEYDVQNTEDIFISHDFGNGNLIEDYRYAYIKDFSDQILNFNEMTRLVPENIATVTFPEVVERYTIAVVGYSSEKNYQEAVFRILFLDGADTSENGLAVEYPIFDEYMVLLKSINMDLADARKVRLERRELSAIEIPDWSVQQNGSVINITGNHDYSEISLVVNHPDPSNTALFKRCYKSGYKNNLDIPFENLEIPIEIVDLLNAQGLSVAVTDTAGEMHITLTQYGNRFDYPNGVYYRPIGNETGDVTTVEFPLSD